MVWKRPYSRGEQTVGKSGMRAASPAHQLAAPRHSAHDFDLTGWIFSSFNCGNVSKGCFKIETECLLAHGQPSVSVDMGMVWAAPTWGQDSCPLAVKQKEEGSGKARRYTEPLSSLRRGVLKAPVSLAAEKLVLPTTFLLPSSF